MGAQVSDAILPAAATWSRVCRRGSALTLEDVEGGANVAALLYRAENPLERYCMPDTLKAQHVGRITAGVALYSDMGRVLASVTEDTCGWHDTITGHTMAEHVAERWGTASYQEHGNDCRRSARHALLVELAKHGLGVRDLVANVNFFSKIAVGEEGELAFVEGHSPAGASVTLRFELDTLVILNSAPHPMDPAPQWSPRPVRLLIKAAAAPPDDDAVRTACPENERGFAASEAAIR